MEEREKIRGYAKEVLEKEAEAISRVIDKIDENFVMAVQAILKTLEAGGRVIVTGIGKSGHVGKKIAASMTSLGVPCYFMHSTEAFHGDLGIIGPQDIVIALSHSGETEEVIEVVSIVKNFGNKVIAIVKDKNNHLAKLADITICTYVEHEADHLNTAPTASSTTTLALGDALAVTIARIRGFNKKDFLKLHPGGTLGKILKYEEGKK